jgi:asparagine synthase (glutamine-hydrolysing)
VALHHYLSFYSVVLAPLTILGGVCKLAPATLLTVEPTGAGSGRRYWSSTQQSNPSAPTADWAGRGRAAGPEGSRSLRLAHGRWQPYAVQT